MTEPLTYWDQQKRKWVTVKRTGKHASLCIVCGTLRGFTDEVERQLCDKCTNDGWGKRIFTTPPELRPKRGNS